MTSLDMAPPLQRGFRRMGKRTLRWGLACALGVMALVLASFLYLHWMGLPEFLKTRILADFGPAAWMCRLETFGCGARSFGSITSE